MWPTARTMRNYTETKTTVPNAVAEANALFATAAALSSALAKYTLTLTAPTPVE